VIGLRIAAFTVMLLVVIDPRDGV